MTTGKPRPDQVPVWKVGLLLSGMAAVLIVGGGLGALFGVPAWAPVVVLAALFVLLVAVFGRGVRGGGPGFYGGGGG
jgi:hypothetical protein